MRRLFVALSAALLVFFGAAGAAPAIASPASASAVHPHCCSSMWFFWASYSSQAKCKAAGKQVMAENPTVILTKCQLEKGKWNLYINELV